MNAVPDVTVIVAVYNTMPYLTTCLTSLVEQSIGQDRMEIIAVDDGSTDGSGKELDRFADLYPGTVRVMHQPNSGGPAAPSNRALELATGRYVYFVGADDYLGAEALERLVKAADEYDSDVVIGKMVGVNGRWVHAPLFKSTEPEIGLDNSDLAWSLNNCKLFRRELIEGHGLRYREDMPVCSDQPFTIEACVRARRISVLADYDYYYAVRRTDSSNITFRTSLLTHLECGVEVLKFTAGLMETGPARDVFLTRHFHTEIAKVVAEDFPRFDRSVQDEICAVIRDVVDEFLTDAVRDRLNTRQRVRLCLAQRGAVDELCAAIGLDTEGTDPLLVIDGDRAYSRYPGFGDERLALPDACFAATGNHTKRIVNGVQTRSVGWSTDATGGPKLDVAVRTALTGPSALDPAVVRIAVVPLPDGKKVRDVRRRPADEDPPETNRQIVQEASQHDAGTDIRAQIPVDSLIAARRSGARRLSVRLDVDVAGTTYEIPIEIPAAVGKALSQTRHWHRARPYRVSPIGENGRLVIAVAPIRPVRVVKQRLQRLTAGVGGTS